MVSPSFRLSDSTPVSPFCRRRSARGQLPHLGACAEPAHKATTFSPNFLTGTCHGGRVARVGGTKWGKVGKMMRSVATPDVSRHVPARGGRQGATRHTGTAAGAAARGERDLQGGRGVPANLPARGMGARAG